MQSINTAIEELVNGTKLYQRRARLVLPLLIRQAKAAKPIYYSQLANEADIPNPRNLNFVLGAIGSALRELSNGHIGSVPLLQCIVLSKTNRLPGNGAGAFISMTTYSQLTRSQKEQLINRLLIEIYAYPHWDRVLDELGLVPAKGLSPDDLIGAGNTGGGGESDEHKLFKEYIAAHPEALGLVAVGKGRTEVLLPSADRIDIVFEQGNLIIAVEVKSVRSNRLDIIRGLFQCVKYKCLVEAEQITSDKYPNCRVILALQGAIPNDLILTRNLLSIDVIDNIKCC